MSSKVLGMCQPRKPPYLKDLREEAKKKKIEGYSSMRKEELCEALGLIEKASPYTKKTVKRGPPKKKEISSITKQYDEYVKKNKLVARPVKEPTRPPPGMENYYYLWIPHEAKQGKGTRRYLVPEGFMVSLRDGKGVKKVPLDYGVSEWLGHSYIGNKNNVPILFPLEKTMYTPIYGEGIDAWVKPSPSYSVVSKRKGFDRYLKNIGETKTDFKKIYKSGLVQAELRRAGNAYMWP